LDHDGGDAKPARHDCSDGGDCSERASTIGQVRGAVRARV
jgi:hypothetical protein